MSRDQNEEGESAMWILEKENSRSSICKGPVAGKCLAHCRNTEEAGTPGTPVRPELSAPEEVAEQKSVKEGGWGKDADHVRPYRLL